MLNRRSAGLTLVAFALALVAAACGGSSTTAVAVASPTAASPPANPSPVDKLVADGARDVKVASVSLPLDFPIVVYTGADEVGASELSFSNLFGREKPVVLNFWAGACPPCRAEMPDIQRVHDEFEDRVVIFGVDIGPFVGLGSQQDAIELIEELGVTYPTGYTQEPGVVSRYKVLGMPTTVFLTPDGKVSRTWTGLLTQGKLTELIQEVLGASGP